MRWVYFIFVLSGFSALLYQVVWQRSLFAIYGINVESVTVIVTAFMLGLGVGSLVGGEISKKASRPALLLFSLVELGIGVFGLLSLPLFHWVGSLTLGMNALSMCAITFLLVLFPTTLMGATLPLLVADSVRASRNVGQAVGVLYFVNTLGSGLAALASVFVILGTLGQAKTVYLAAATNLTVSAIAFVSSTARGARARARRRSSGSS